MPSRNRIFSIVLMIFLGTMINYMDRVNISLTAPDMIKEFNWSTEELGVLLSSFFWGYFLFQLPGGWLADRFGGRRVMTVSGILWAVFTILTVIPKSLGILVFVRAGLGVGEAVNFPSGTSLVARWLSPKTISRVQGFNFSAIALGPLVATPLTVYFMTMWGWRSVFYFFALISVLWAIVWWLLTRRAGLSDAPSKDTQIMDDSNNDLIEKPLRSMEVWGVSIAWYCASYVFYFLITFLPTYFTKAVHLPVKDLAVLGTVPWAVLFVMMNVAGWILDYIARTSSHSIFWRRMIYAGAYIWTGIFMWWAKGATSATSAVILISTALFGLAFTWPVAWSLPAVYSRSKAGLLGGFMNAWGQVAGILAPIITGTLAAHNNWSGAFIWAAVFSILGAVLVAGTSKWSTDKSYVTKSRVNEAKVVTDNTTI